MEFTSADIAKIVNGRLLPAATDELLTGISTDSRTLQPGDLFVPLRGPNYDGHDYLRQAVEHGAAACLSEEVVGGLSVPVIQVDDALRGLGEIAGSLRSGFSGAVVAITGTTGKTSTKEMLASILNQQQVGLKTEGNFNNLIGLPLTLARLEAEHRWIVLEMGMSIPGEIFRLAQIAQARVAVITNVGAGHLAGVGNIAAVAQEKGQLFASLSAGATAVVNVDDPLVAGLPLPTGVQRLSFGIENQATVGATDIVSGKETVFTLTLGGQSAVVKLPLPGRHQIYNALAAAAAALSLGVSLSDIVQGLEMVQMSAGRLEVRSLDAGITVLDDSYNANPQSMRAALTTLGDWPCDGRRIAVLADMLELGTAAEECHREIGAFAAQKVDCLISMGSWAATVLQAGATVAHDCCDAVAQDDGVDGERVFTPCPDHGAISRWLRHNLRPEDCVLVKGSRGMHMEKVIQQLLAE
jgi:UDP-N-acetylmuramoyl-tripeptide--D-alanyl-D-alanine ligase